MCVSIQLTSQWLQWYWMENFQWVLSMCLRMYILSSFTCTYVYVCIIKPSLPIKNTTCLWFWSLCKVSQYLKVDCLHLRLNYSCAKGVQCTMIHYMCMRCLVLCSILLHCCKGGCVNSIVLCKWIQFLECQQRYVPGSS